MLNSQNQIVLPDINTVLAAQSDPTLNYDSNDLRVATVLFNTIVPFLDLEKYDFIKQRFLKEGSKNLTTIGESEFADALYDVGIAPDDFAVLVIEDSPLPIDIQDVIDLIEELDKTVNDELEAELGGVIVDVGAPNNDGTTPITVQQPDGTLEDINIPTPTTDPGGSGGSGAPAAFPPIFSTTTPIVPVAGVGGSPAGTDDPETTEDDNETGIDTTQQWEPGPKLAAALSVLNNTYGDLWVENNEIDSDSCKFGASNILPPLFTKILSQVMDRKPFLSGVRGFISSVQSLVQINISHILAEVIGPLQAAVEQVNSLAQSAFARIEGIFNEASTFISGMPGWAPDRVGPMLMREFQKYANFFAEFNVEMIRRKLKEFAHIMELRLDPQTLAGVLPRITQDLVKKNVKYRSCKFSSIVDELFKKVTNEFRKFKDAIFGGYNALAALGGGAVNESLDYGAQRVPAKAKRELAEKWRDTNNTKTENADLTGLEPTVYVPGNVTEADRMWVRNNISSSGIAGYLSFNDNVSQMGARALSAYRSQKQPVSLFSFSENKSDDGWFNVDSEVWVRAIRAAKRLQDQGVISGPVVVNSAYRSPYYNKVIAKSVDGSLHTTGHAIDWGNNLTASQRARLLKAASQEGFGGTYPGSVFIHSDIGSNRGYGSFVNRNDAEPYYAYQIHRQGRYRNG